MIPDGRWSERIYTEAAVPGDDGIYVSQVNIEKRGRLPLRRQRGDVAPVRGSINNTYAGFVGAVLAPLTLMLAYDLGGVCGGVSPTGQVPTRCRGPSPVPTTRRRSAPPGVCNMPMVVATATGATAKMVACADPPLA